MSPTNEQVTITAPASTWLTIGRDIGGARRAMVRIMDIINQGHDGTEEGIAHFIDRIERLASHAEEWFTDARLKWADLIETQAPELPEEAQGGSA